MNWIFTQIMDLVDSRCLLNIFQTNKKALPTEVSPTEVSSTAQMDRIQNFQKTTRDAVNPEPANIWKDRTAATTDAARDARKDQLSEAWHVILMLVGISCCMWEAREI